jgi:hypothetical protein
MADETTRTHDEAARRGRPSPDEKTEMAAMIDSWATRLGLFGVFALLEKFAITTPVTVDTTSVATMTDAAPQVMPVWGKVLMAFFGDPTIFGVLLTGTKIALLAAVLAPMLRYAALERFGQDDGPMKILRFCALLMAAVVTIGIALASFGIDIRTLLPDTIPPVFALLVSAVIVIGAVAWAVALFIFRGRERSVTFFELTDPPHADACEPDFRRGYQQGAQSMVEAVKAGVPIERLQAFIIDELGSWRDDPAKPAFPPDP